MRENFIKANKIAQKGLFHEGAPKPDEEDWPDMSSRPDYRTKIRGTILIIDNSQVPFFVERISNEILFGAQFILETHRTKDRRMFMKIMEIGRNLQDFSSVLQSVYEFYTDGIDTISSRTTKGEVTILGLGFSSLQDPYELLSKYLKILEGDQIQKIEKSIDKNIIDFIVGKFVLSEPLTIKCSDFYRGMLYLSYLMTKTSGFDFKFAIHDTDIPQSEKIPVKPADSPPDILLKFNTSLSDVDLDAMTFGKNPTEMALYCEIGRFFLNNVHSQQFANYIRSGDRKGLSKALIAGYTPNDSSQLKLPDLFTFPLGRKIAQERIRGLIESNPSDLFQRLESIFFLLDRRGQKDLLDDLANYGIIVPGIFGKGIGSSLAVIDTDYYHLLCSFNTPDYRQLHAALFAAIANQNWSDDAVVEAANSRLASLLSQQEKDLGDIGRMVGNILYTQLSFRNKMDKKIESRYGRNLESIYIPNIRSDNGLQAICRNILLPLLGGVICFLAGIVGTIWYYLGFPIPFGIDPLILVGIIAGILIVVIIISLLVRTGFRFKSPTLLRFDDGKGKFK